MSAQDKIASEVIRLTTRAGQSKTVDEAMAGYCDLRNFAKSLEDPQMRRATEIAAASVFPLILQMSVLNGVGQAAREALAEFEAARGGLHKWIASESS